MDAQELRQAIELLTASGNFDFIDVEEDGTVCLSSLGGTRMRLSIHDFVAHQTVSSLIHEPPPILFDTNVAWTDGMLERRRLPPEWSRSWLVARLGEADGDIALVSSRTGRPIASLKDMQDKHEIKNWREEYVRYLWETGKYTTQIDLVKVTGLSKATISRYIGGAARSVKRADQHENSLIALGKLSPALPAAQMTKEFTRIMKTELHDPRNARKLQYAVKRLRKESKT